ncbi:MAG TPA: hypothetical protein VIS06_17540 [Mycobacteriales bacterium]
MVAPIGELVARAYPDGRVEIVQADARIMVSPELMIQADPEYMAVAWPDVTFVGQITYRIVEFDLGSRAFVAEKQGRRPDASAESAADRFMREHFDPGLVGPA